MRWLLGVIAAIGLAYWTFGAIGTERLVALVLLVGLIVVTVGGVLEAFSPDRD